MRDEDIEDETHRHGFFDGDCEWMNRATRADTRGESFISTQHDDSVQFSLLRSTTRCL